MSGDYGAIPTDDEEPDMEKGATVDGVVDIQTPMDENGRDGFIRKVHRVQI